MNVRTVTAFATFIVLTLTSPTGAQGQASANKSGGQQRQQAAAQSEEPISLDMVCGRGGQMRGRLIGGIIGAAGGALAANEIAGRQKCTPVVDSRGQPVIGPDGNPLVNCESSGASTGALIAGAIIGGAGGAAIGNEVGKRWDKKKCDEAQAVRRLAMLTGGSHSVSTDDGDRFQAVGLRSFAGESSFTRNVQVLEGRAISLGDMRDAYGVYEVVAPPPPPRPRAQPAAAPNRNQRARAAAAPPAAPTAPSPPAFVGATVRAAPSLEASSTVFETLPVGVRVAAVAQSVSGEWLLVSTGGRIADGWVRASQLRLTESDVAAFERGEARKARSMRVGVRANCTEVGGKITLGGVTTEEPATRQCTTSRDRTRTERIST